MSPNPAEKLLRISRWTRLADYLYFCFVVNYGVAPTCPAGARGPRGRAGRTLSGGLTVSAERHAGAVGAQLVELGGALLRALLAGRAPARGLPEDDRAAAAAGPRHGQRAGPRAHAVPVRREAQVAASV